MKKSFLLLLLFTLLGNSCSLLKFSISTGDTPLPKADVEMRNAARGYFASFKKEIVQTADSIASLSNDPTIKARAIKWKLKVTAAAAAAVYQSAAEVGMINLWVLSLQQQQMMQEMSDSALFGSYSPAIRRFCTTLTVRIEELTRQFAPKDRFALIQRFVTTYAKKNLIENFNFTPDNLMIEWIAFLDQQKIPYNTTTGLMSEVMADMSDRVSGYTTQTADELSWGGELLRLSLQQDSLAQQFTMQVNTLSGTLVQMANTLDNSPEMIDRMSKGFAQEMNSVLLNLDYTLQQAFSTLSSERLALQEYASIERDALLKQAENAAHATIQSTFNLLPALLGKVLIYIVIGVLLLFSIPLWIGYILGKRANKKKKNTNIQ